MVLQTTNSIKFAHFSVLSPFQRFILAPFQHFIPISAFYPRFTVLSPFQFPLSVSVSAIRFQRFIPTLPLTAQPKQGFKKFYWY
jgi:hypothetical protein